MKIKNILWDFDGVILDSMNVRDFGFREIFREFDKDSVELLIKYHRLNGGLSRYVKIDHFFLDILKKPISKKKLQEYADEFSNIMRIKLTDPKNLILDSLKFIKNNHFDLNFHIVSGSDQKELQFLCEKLGIAQYFKSIHGSPTPKSKLVSDLLSHYDYQLKNTCLIGDSINDLEAANDSGVEFYGYNNCNLLKLNCKYIYSFETFKLN